MKLKRMTAALLLLAMLLSCLPLSVLAADAECVTVLAALSMETPSGVLP